MCSHKNILSIITYRRTNPICSTNTDYVPMNVTIAVGVVPIVATMLVVGLAVVIVVVAVVSVVVVTGSRKFLHSINQSTILNY